MQIKISLPNPTNSSINTYSEIKGYLKQLELAVHHAQKAVESYKKDTGVEEITEDSWLTLAPDYLSDILKTEAVKAIKEKKVDTFVKNLAEDGLDDYYEEKQYLDLTIELEPGKESKG